jgi:hypothetical protein
MTAINFSPADPSVGALLQSQPNSHQRILVVEAEGGIPFVTPQNVKSIGMDVLRHRVAITGEAEAEKKTSKTASQKIFDGLWQPSVMSSARVKTSSRGFGS